MLHDNMTQLDIKGNRKDDLLEDALSDSFFEFKDKPKTEKGKVIRVSNTIIWVSDDRSEYDRQWHSIKDMVKDYSFQHVYPNMAHLIMPTHPLIIADYESFFKCQFKNGLQANLYEVVSAESDTPIVLLNVEGHKIEPWILDKIKNSCDLIYLPHMIKNILGGKK